MSPSDAGPPAKPVASTANPRCPMPPFAALHSALLRSTVMAGTLIFTQGELADPVSYYIEEGRVQLKVVSPQGKEGIIAILDAGHFCGDDCLSGETVRMCSATCLTDGVIVRLDAASLRRAVRQEPAFAEFYLASLLKRNESFKGNLISQLTDTSERRLARVLLRLANCEPDSRQSHAVAHLDQETLAQMVGTTRSRINYFMNRFRALGHIDYNGKIFVRASLWSVVEGQSGIGNGTGTQEIESGSLARF